MILEVKNFEYKINHRISCFVSSLINALKNRNVTIDATEAMLYARVVTFTTYIDLEETGKPTLIIMPCKLDFFENFAWYTNISISFYTGQKPEEDIRIISDAVSRNICLTAVTDQIEMLYAYSDQYKKLFTPDQRIPHHYITIHGVNTKTGALLCAEPNFTIKDYDYWHSYDVMEKARSCKLYSRSINRDLYVIEDVSSYAPPTMLDAFKKQLELLVDQINDAIRMIEDFLKTHIVGHADDTELIASNFNAMAMFLTMVDQTGYLYRDYLYKAAKQVIAHEGIVLEYQNLYQQWKRVVNDITEKKDNGIVTYEEYLVLYKSIIETAKSECDLHKKTLGVL